ncbi:cell wall metabolism sensor histidine kinase WalK [Aeoliella sp. ICT_H6.2]|uniref:histidine kinase n=1 Tax=Aeoliella straminimaris TaxID=2954799 RepID=A0A9X2FHK1_9BACT|nr:HAMP domain-containing sensor histidine kinase [Aeoliella straminimaris]MCO6046161.1 cell wall metabolism sensor histidine kinase WalK [Aeoliella straminimaris]
MILRTRLFLRRYVAIFGVVALATIVTAMLANQWHDSDRFGTLLVRLVLVVLGIAGVLSYFIVRSVVNPLLELCRATRAIGEGDYGQRVPVRTDDELGDLARSVNQISGELGNRLLQLHASDERQAAVLGGMVEGVIAVDNQEHVLFANAAAGRMFGFMPPSAEGRRLLEVVRDHTLQQAVSDVLEKRKPQTLEIEWQLDTPKILAAQVTPLPGSEDVGAVIVLHDNSELRRLETIRQEFIANVSHELKTPLSSMMAYAETLQRGALDDSEIRDSFLARIMEQGERLNNLIQDMLRLARIETAQQPFEIEPVDVGAVLGQCVHDYHTQAEAKSIELVYEPPADKTYASADEEGLRVICNNLIDNALKYTPDGGRVEVRWRRDNDTVLLEVKDNGPGIPRGDAARVFERFYRVDKARSRELGSTGLGLSIVKHLVQSFSGAVGVESQPGHGSRFWVELPTAR